MTRGERLVVLFGALLALVGVVYALLPFSRVMAGDGYVPLVDCGSVLSPRPAASVAPCSSPMAIHRLIAAVAFFGGAATMGAVWVRRAPQREH